MTIKNVAQQVSDGYYNNPFWEKHGEPPLDYELELINEMHEIGWSDEEILKKALRYLGWDKLVDEYEKDGEY